MELNYVKHKIANLLSINKIVTIHYYELNHKFSFDGERHNFWEMVFVDAGSVEIKSNNQTYHLHQGDVIFHKPNEFHTLKTYQNSAANVFVIAFVCSSDAMNFFKGKMMKVPAKLKVYLSTLVEEYQQTFKPMSAEDVQLEIKDNPLIGGQQIIRSCLEQFLIMLIRSENDKRHLQVFPSKESMENHLVSQMMHLIEEKIYEKISVEQICNTCNFSRAYLSKIFKSSTGYTILEYILKHKIREAKKLIREGNLNFSQISDLLAFDNPHYFSRVFKRMTNMTPSEYKQSAQTI